ncbi:UNVERIFIED_CONTAM: hypothetical protein GTU68_037419, partial [Idotea baltica]|nr:hypothetical protein [Idotea baltica]
MLMMALKSPALDVRAITTVAGNVPLRLTSRNARMMRQIMDRPDIPVFAGCPGPLLRPPVTAEDFHGETGISGINVFEPDAPLASQHATSFLVETLRNAAPKEYTLVVTGPMTNIAAAITLDPSLLNGVRELIVMAGANTAGGNITPFSEFNVFADPHAAAIVFNTGTPITVLSLDVTHTVRADPPRIARLSAIETTHAQTMADLLTAANALEARWKPGLTAPMHDPSTIAYLLAPHLFETKTTQVSVDTQNGVRFG